MPVGPFSPELMAQQYVLMEWGQGCSHMFIGIIREKISVELRTVYSLVSYIQYFRKRMLQERKILWLR